MGAWRNVGYQDGRSEELNKGVRSSKSQDENYLFVYYEGKDTAKQVTEKTKEWAYQDTRTASSSYANYFPTDTPPKMRSRTYWQYKYHYTQIGVMYKMGHGLSFVIGILLPFTLLLLTLLLERAIIRKLEKMNE